MSKVASACVQGVMVVFLLAGVAVAQMQPMSGAHVIKIRGTLRDGSGDAVTGVQGVTLAVYPDEQGGTALWIETQNLTADAQGHYTVLLGATEPGGLPIDLFASGESRWLGVQVNQPGQLEQPRVLLVSVPYALNAADADTLGGLPASAFLLNPDQITQRVEQSGGIIAQPPGGFTANASGTGTQGYVPLWTDNAGTLGNAAFFQSGGNIGLGTSSPATLLHVANNSTYTVDSTAALTVSNGTTPAMRMMFGYDSNLGRAYIQATQEGVDVQPLLFNPLGGAVGLGTTSPQATMHVAQDSAYTSDTAAGLLVSNRTTPAKRMMFGYDANIDAGYVQTTQSGVNVKPFVMNPAGGNVGINKTTATQPLDVNGNIASNATISANLFSGSAASLTSLNASNISSGTLSAARGGTGLASCSTNQTLSWNGSAWACASAGGGGTVTSVGSGTGLTGGLITTTGTLAVDATAVPFLASSNTFTAPQTITAGNLSLTSGNIGVGESTGLSRMTVQGKANFAGSGTISVASGSTTVSGSGTSFLSQLGIGDQITVGASNETQYVASIASNTSLTSVASFGTTESSSAFTVLPSLLRVDSSGGGQDLMLSNNGNLGIGTVNPLDKVVVVGSDSTANGTGAAIRLRNAAAGGSLWDLRVGATGTNTPAAGFSIGDASNNYRLVINSSGNVGLGTTSPGYLLDVQGGQINASGGLCIAGTCQTSWPAGSGTVTSITANGGLTASPNPIIGSGTISVAAGGITNAMLAASSVTSADIVTGTIVDSNISSSAPMMVRAITYLAGCDSCSALTTSDSQRTIFDNLIGSMNITAITCFVDGGSGTFINVVHNVGGTTNNVLSSSLNCSTSASGATSTTFNGTQNQLALGDTLDFTLATADSVAKRVTLAIKAVVN